MSVGWYDREKTIARYMYANGRTFEEIGAWIGKSKSAVRSYFYKHPKMFEAPPERVNVKKQKKTPQLCLDCARSGGGYGCPWVSRGEPVPGWKATEVKPPDTAFANGAWYAIFDCPMFVPNAYEKTLGAPTIEYERDYDDE